MTDSIIEPCGALGEPGVRIHHIATIGFICLLVVLAIGCSRMTAEEEAAVRQSFGVPADMPMKDLGEIELRAGMPKRVRLGAGRDCTLTATLLTNGLVQLIVHYEFKGQIIDGVKTPSHSERSQSVFRPDSVPAGWRLCLFPKGQHFVLAMRPTILP
jgi:hypothetical protein